MTNERVVSIGIELLKNAYNDFVKLYGELDPLEPDTRTKLGATTFKKRPIKPESEAEKVYGFLLEQGYIQDRNGGFVMTILGYSIIRSSSRI